MLVLQLLDLKLKARNGTVPTVGPPLKDLCLLEQLRVLADFDHLHTTHLHSE
jgi:hypothetical protein